MSKEIIVNIVNQGAWQFPDQVKEKRCMGEMTPAYAIASRIAYLTGLKEVTNFKIKITVEES